MERQYTRVMSPIDKREVFSLALKHLESELALVERVAKKTAAEATHEEARPENDKDTRALEQSYLARGQSKRVEELREEVARFRVFLQSVRDFAATEPVTLSAIAEVEVDGEPRLFGVAPSAGGAALEVGDVTVTIVTPSSPVGRALLGKRVDDDFELRVGRHLREYIILHIA